MQYWPRNHSSHFHHVSTREGNDAHIYYDKRFLAATRQLTDTKLTSLLPRRYVFANVVKYVKMAASSSYGNMFSVLGASMVLPFAPMLPLQVRPLPVPPKLRSRSL